MKQRVTRHEVVQPLDKSIRLIPLTQGMNAIVDATDYEWLMQWSWFAAFPKDRFYAYAHHNGRNIRMNRLIMGFPKGKDVDHKNGNTLDNRRCNLRVATRSQNTINSGKYKHNTSGYKGVAFDKRCVQRPWRAKITVNNRQVNLGYFPDAESAARAYDSAALTNFGEFAILNFPHTKLP